MKLSKEDKKEMKVWLKALRSGKYKQAKNSLQNAYGYCCLGVACDILIPDKKLKYEKDIKFLVGGLPEDQPASPEWLNVIAEVKFNIPEKNRKIYLSELNDHIGYSFSQIADLVEDTFLKGDTHE
jgi:hypothetical protein